MSRLRVRMLQISELCERSCYECGSPIIGEVGLE